MGILDSLLGNTSAKASQAAAADTYAKQQAATQGLTNYASTVPGQYNQIAGGYAPYAAAGGDALKQLMGGLGLNGAQGSADFTNAYHALPGYESGLATGERAVNSAANAGGMLNSGRTVKAAQRFGQDYEDQKSGNYLQQLAGLSGMGQQATGAQAGLQAQGLGAETGLRQSAYGGQMNSAGTIGQGQVAGAQAQQQGIGNLLSSAAYLGGAALGGPAGGALGGLLKSGAGALGGGIWNNATNGFLGGNNWLKFS